eukprot:607305-Pyramimonas_sp.AAC.1
MVAIATGGTWPRQRRHKWAPTKVDNLCPRCKRSPETMFHRCWSCDENNNSKAHTVTDELLPEAYSQHEATQCFWLRGLIPKSWTAVSPPPLDYNWKYGGRLNSSQKTLG